MPTFTDEFASSDGSSRAHELELSTVWRVNADDSYRVRRNAPAKDCFIALRTHHGTGHLSVARGQEFVLDAGTFLIAENKNITQYHCVGGRWDFWWFEFRFFEPPHFMTEQILRTDLVPDEKEECAQIFSGLQRMSFLERALASARFTTLLYRWLVASASVWQRTPQMELVEKLIERMRARPAGWSVAEMAREMHLCERHLRHIFKAQTGKSPKQFYDETRLNAARQMLEQGFVNGAEAAERFGFSSPAHFSKAFSDHFGLPPSRVAAKAML